MREELEESKLWVEGRHGQLGRMRNNKNVFMKNNHYLHS